MKVIGTTININKKLEWFYQGDDLDILTVDGEVFASGEQVGSFSYRENIKLQYGNLIEGNLHLKVVGHTCHEVIHYTTLLVKLHLKVFTNSQRDLLFVKNLFINANSFPVGSQGQGECIFICYFSIPSEKTHIIQR